MLMSSFIFRLLPVPDNWSKVASRLFDRPSSVSGSWTQASRLVVSLCVIAS